MAATYSVSTVGTNPVHGVRRYLGDVNIASPIFDDAEIAFFLAARNGSSGFDAVKIRLAAADALDALANDAGRVAKMIRLPGGLVIDKDRAWKSLTERAKQLRHATVVLPVVESFDRIFTLDDDDGATVGSIGKW